MLEDETAVYFTREYFCYGTEVCQVQKILREPAAAGEGGNHGIPPPKDFVQKNAKLHVRLLSDEQERWPVPGLRDHPCGSVFFVVALFSSPNLFSSVNDEIPRQRRQQCLLYGALLSAARPKIWIWI